MNRFVFASSCMAGFLLSGCNCSNPVTPQRDASSDVATDRAAADTMTVSDVRIDSAQDLDARTVDAASDTNTVDTNTTDTNTTDTNTVDTNTTDTNRTDVSTGDACVRSNYSLAPYRTNCPPGGTLCADPYSCITFSRFLPEYRCLIPCQTDCECEASQNCIPMGDNTGNRYFCATLE